MYVHLCVHAEPGCVMGQGGGAGRRQWMVVVVVKQVAQRWLLGAVPAVSPAPHVHPSFLYAETNQEAELGRQLSRVPSSSRLVSS